MWNTAQHLWQSWHLDSILASGAFQNWSQERWRRTWHENPWKPPWSRYESTNLAYDNGIMEPSWCENACPYSVGKPSFAIPQCNVPSTWHTISPSPTKSIARPCTPAPVAWFISLDNLVAFWPWTAAALGFDEDTEMHAEKNTYAGASWNAFIDSLILLHQNHIMLWHITYIFHKYSTANRAKPSIHGVFLRRISCEWVGKESRFRSPHLLFSEFLGGRFSDIFG